jgi:very-short-patch-repair endonuclease
MTTIINDSLDLEHHIKAILRGRCWTYLEPYQTPKSPWKVMCDHHHIHTIIPSRIIKHSSKLTCRWCRQPYHQTEQRLFNFFIEIDQPFYCQYACPWSEKNYRYDFVFLEKKIIIELDGPQHFRQIGSWTAPEKIRQGDYEKMVLANHHGFTIVRLVQDEVYKDTFLWKPHLHLILSTSYEKPIYIFLTSDEEIYNPLKSLLQIS